MNLNDFCCMRQGRCFSRVSTHEAQLMKTFERSNGKKQRGLLLLHGFASTPAVYRELFPDLLQYDTVIAPLLPGHGVSIQEFSELKMSDLVATVEAICHRLTQEFQCVDVLGLSMGGLLACHLSIQFPLNHLYLLAPALDLHLELSSTLLLTRTLMRLGFQRLRSAAGNIHIPNHCEISYRQLPLTTIRALLTFIQNFKLILPSCPTDLFLGYHDEVVASEKVAARFLDNSATRIHWLNNSAHVLPLDGDIKAIIDCLREG